MVLKISIIKFIILPILLTTSQNIFERNAIPNECINTFNITGRCIALKDCPYEHNLFSYLNRTKNNNKYSADRERINIYTDYLRKSFCGWEKGSPKVCCDTDLLPDIQKCQMDLTPVTNRINAGREAELNEFPWIVLLVNEKVRGRNALYCGGSLINERYVLTAAHCFHEPEMYNRVFVRLGEHDVRTERDCRKDSKNRTICNPSHIDIQIESKIIHEGFEPINFHHDIALIRLAEPVNFTNNIKPICLLDIEYEPEEFINTTMFEVAGWGKEGNEGNFSDVKLKTWILGYHNNDCHRKYNTTKPPKTITINQFCAGGTTTDRADACQGDSGGPVIAQHGEGVYKYQYMVGLVSYGLQKCGTKGWPTVYTRVSRYLPWIRDKMRP